MQSKKCYGEPSCRKSNNKVKCVLRISRLNHGMIQPMSVVILCHTQTV